MLREQHEDSSDVEVSVILVSFNTRELTLKALETLFLNAGNIRMRVIVWDNASADGSADAIAERFPQAELIRSEENIGFAAANNEAAKLVASEWLLLLNPDTETHPNAIENIFRYAKAHPETGIVGGRTVFPDGSLNPSSCWNKPTVWSLFCAAFGLRKMFPHTNLFNSEGMGGWRRDTARHVDIVVGCFFLIPTALWRKLGGFDQTYFMYGEEADLCLRAAQAGYSPAITPDAQIMHLVGGSTPKLGGKLIRLMKARATLLRDHWHAFKLPFGLALLWAWSFNHKIASVMTGWTKAKDQKHEAWDALWDQRADWLKGYRQNP